MITAREYRAMVKDFIRNMDYHEVRDQFLQGVALAREVCPRNLRPAVEIMVVLSWIQLQWYRLLNWGLKRR